MLSIHLRPPEVEDRQFPGHWEGDIIKGAGNASAVGTLAKQTAPPLVPEHVLSRQAAACA